MLAAPYLVSMHAIHAILGAYVERVRPPVEIRHELDITYTVEGHNVFINEVRPAYPSKTQLRASPNVKFTYVESRDVWKIYWMRGNLQWSAYGPAPEVKTLEEAVAIYDRDDHYCFKG